MSKIRFTAAERVHVTPEYLRVMHIAEHKERERVRKLEAAKRALSLINKLSPSPTKARHSRRIFILLNRFRAES